MVRLGGSITLRGCAGRLRSALSRSGRARFASIRDLVRRMVGRSAREELGFAGAGGGVEYFIREEASHRRGALWDSELAARRVGELLESATTEAGLRRRWLLCRLKERLFADYRSTGLTIGMHPMRLHREHMNRLGVIPARG